MWILLTKVSTIHKSAHSFVNTLQDCFSPLASCVIFFDTTSFGIYFKVKLYSLVRVNPTNFGIMISQVFILTSMYYITFHIRTAHILTLQPYINSSTTFPYHSHRVNIMGAICILKECIQFLHDFSYWLSRIVARKFDQHPNTQESYLLRSYTPTLP